VKKILVVDDEPDILTLVKARLMANNYEVLTAATGNEGLNLAKTMKPDAVILDIILPDLDGSAVAEKLLEDKNTKDIPVLFLTAMITREEVAKNNNIIGGRFFLAKPFKGEELLERLKQILGE
jgi:DNA-binding response OmpR family regulator